MVRCANRDESSIGRDIHRSDIVFDVNGADVILLDEVVEHDGLGSGLQWGLGLELE